MRYAARYGHPFRAPKWTSSSLEGSFQEIAEDEQGKGERCMGSCFHKEIWLSLRRQWGANRDLLSPFCLCFRLSLGSLGFSLSFLPSLYSLFSSYMSLFLSLSLSLSTSLYVSLRSYELQQYYHRVVCSIWLPRHNTVRKRLDTRNCGNVDTNVVFFLYNLQ